MSFSQIATKGIVLTRVDYGEADRILSWLTPDQGKISLIAKAVKRERSKLAGGIEYFSESDISFVRGRGEVGTLTSARLIHHWDHIVRDIARTGSAFAVLKTINKTTEDRAGAEWYELTKSALAGLDNPDLPQELTELWFNLHWLKLSGHAPNLKNDGKGQALTAEMSYKFNFERMAFYEGVQGTYNPNHIKLLRLVLSADTPVGLAKIQNLAGVLPQCAELAKAMLTQLVQI